MLLIVDGGLVPRTTVVLQDTQSHRGRCYFFGRMSRPSLLFLLHKQCIIFGIADQRGREHCHSSRGQVRKTKVKSPTVVTGLPPWTMISNLFSVLRFTVGGSLCCFTFV